MGEVVVKTPKPLENEEEPPISREFCLAVAVPWIPYLSMSNTGQKWNGGVWQGLRILGGRGSGQDAKATRK